MKRRIFTLVLLGVVSVMMMGFRTATPDNHSLSPNSIIIVKGQAYNVDKDKYWEKVTFGLYGADPEDCSVYVKILDKQGRLIAMVDEFDVKNGTWISFYVIDLEHYGIHQDFQLEIHIQAFTGLWSLNSYRFSGTSAQTAAPIDPEETVLIVKYP